MKKAWMLALPVAFVFGCTSVPKIKDRVETEVRNVSEAAAGEVVERDTPFLPWRQPEPADVIDGVILGDRLYRIAIHDIRLADVRREDAKWQPWPRLIADGWIEAPVGSDSDVYLSGGLFLRFDLVRAILYKNAVTVAEVLQAVSLQRRLDAANNAAVLFLKRAVDLKATQRAQEHQQRVCKLIDHAEADGESLFMAGKLPSNQWHTWKHRRIENEIESERLVIRQLKAEWEIAQSYRGMRSLEAVAQSADQFIERLSVNRDGTPEKMSAVLMRAPGVTDARLALFLAEVSILESRLKWLPSLKLDLGGGRIPLRGNSGREHRGIVPAGGASMTLYDFGEIARGVKRAEIETVQARERMLQAVEVARSNLETASQQTQRARAMIDSATKRCAAAERMAAEIRALMEAGKMSVMDVHETEWLRLEAEALLERCRNDYRFAVIEERAARNEVLDEERQKRVFGGYAGGGRGEQEWR